MKAALNKVLWVVVVSLIASGCMYRMPTEDDVDVMPLTNNPNVVPQRGQTGMVPGMQY